MLNYQDLSYIQKRSLLRQFYTNNSSFHTIIKKIVFKVQEKIKNPIIYKLLDYDTTISYLINGFLAFEIIDNYNFYEIDPTTLYLTYKDNKMCWYQYKNESNERILEKEKIIYITYGSYETSFLEPIYLGLVDINDQVFINQHVDYIVNKLTNNTINYDEILNIDTNIVRSLKIKKLYEHLDN